MALCVLVLVYSLRLIISNCIGNMSIFAPHKQGAKIKNRGGYVNFLNMCHASLQQFFPIFQILISKPNTLNILIIQYFFHHQ